MSGWVVFALGGDPKVAPFCGNFLTRQRFKGKVARLNGDAGAHDYHFTRKPPG